MDGSRCGAGTDGVDENRGVGALQQVDQRGARTIGGDDFAIRRRRFGEEARDFQPDGVVAERAAYSDDTNQSFSISSFKKCVEHEMQGS